MNENYLSRTKVTSDPILGHISFCLSENYLDGNKEYNFENARILCSTVCSHFNGWLGKIKCMYTYGEKCKLCRKLWEKEINPLYTLLNEKNKMLIRRKK